MSEKRFNLSNPISHNPIPSWVNIIHDDMRHKHLNAEEIVDLLNEQQAIIEAKDSLLSILSKENKQLRQKLDFYLLDEFEWKEKYGD